MKQVITYQVLDKTFGDEKSAKQYEYELICKLRKFQNYDNVWIFDYLNSRILNSYIKDARINEYSPQNPIEYIIEGFDNPADEKEIFNTLDELINNLKANIKVIG